MTSRHIILVIVILIVAVGVGVYEARQTSALRTELESRRQQEAPLAQQIEQLTRERDEATHQLAPLRAANEQLIRSNSELPKLRGEITRLRREARESAQLKTTVDAMSEPASQWLNRAGRWKQIAEQRPQLTIPEFQFLTEDNWRSKGDPGFPIKTEDDIRRGMAYLRLSAKSQFVSKIGTALNDYIAAHDGQLPSDILQLKPHFDSPVDDATLQRYKLQHTGKLSDYPESEVLVTEKAPVDKEFDFLWSITAYGAKFEGIGKNSGGGGRAEWSTNLTARLKPFAR